MYIFHESKSPKIVIQIKSKLDWYHQLMSGFCLIEGILPLAKYLQSGKNLKTLMPNVEIHLRWKKNFEIHLRWKKNLPIWPDIVVDDDLQGHGLGAWAGISTPTAYHWPYPVRPIAQQKESCQCYFEVKFLVFTTPDYPVQNKLGSPLTFTFNKCTVFSTIYLINSFYWDEESIVK